MNLIDLIHTPHFWIVFVLSGVVLTALIFAAACEASTAFSPAARQRRVKPPGVWGICVGGTRIALWGGEPCTRIFQLQTYLEFITHEPSILAWYVAGWTVVLQEWQLAAYWFGGAFLWRMTCDVLFEPAPAGSRDIRFQRAVVKCAWAASTGVVFAAISAAILGYVLLLLGVLAALCGASSERGRRRR